MKISTLLVIGILAFALPCFGQGDPPLEEIIVAGRQPGPPMWRVGSGDNVLWIFPLPDLVPKNMIWDSDRVAAVIAGSQEALSIPDIEIEMSRLMMLNPINIIRGIRLGNRIRQSPNNATLKEILPADLYERFSALKAEYFPRNDRIETLRPLMAGTSMVSIIHREFGVVSGTRIARTVRRLIRSNNDIEQTDIAASLDLEGSFRELANRIESMMASLSRDYELACFEAQIERMENDLDAVRRRAFSWAQGSISEFRRMTLPGGADDVCNELILESSEGETFEDLISRRNSLWLEAAETALARNRSTFAVLSITTLLQEDGPISQLQDKGYDVRTP